MSKKIKLIIGNFLLIILLLLSSTPAYARIIFADDVFTNNSEIYEIGSDDDADFDPLALKFGGMNPEYFYWNTSAFTFTDDITVQGNSYIQGIGIMLDSDNTGTGEDVYIAANQGSDNDGYLRYSATNDRWEISNDSGPFTPILTGSSLNLDTAYDNFGASPSTVTVDAAEGQTGGLKFDGSLSTDETVTITNSSNGGVLSLENSGTGTSFKIFNSLNPTATEWQIFDDGTNQVSILSGTQDPRVTATDADTGSIFLNTNTGEFFVKQDDGLTTNWNLGTLSSDLSDALLGTFGTPSGTNRFVTDTDPRLGQNSGAFGETALGTHLDYLTTNLSIDRALIYYTRIFLPAQTTVNSVGVYTTQYRYGNINLGIYSDNSGPYSLLTQTGTQSGVISPQYDFWEYDLSSPYTTSDAGFYWLAMASTANPKAAMYNDADDRFIPYRIQSKSTSSTTLPTNASPTSLGNITDIPYVAAFE